MINVYKDRSPEQTILAIQEILSKLGIHPQEVGWDQYSENIHSGRIVDPEYPVGTNGKGINKTYAMASAYAEFMERLQNNILYGREYGLKSTTKLMYPDVVEQDSLKAWEDQSQIFTRLVDVERDELISVMGDRIYTAPYYNLDSGRVVNLPVELISYICMSNGMCAGNTPAEAITQGICEILERFARQQVYLHDWDAPEIPTQYARQFSVFRLIEDLQEQGYSVSIKDCTLGGRIPVLAVAIFNASHSHYRLSFGSDPLFEIALQRCLTEAVQGIPPAQLASDWMTDFDLSGAAFADPNTRITELLKAMMDGSGRCPPAFFLSKGKPRFKGAFQQQFRNSLAAFKHVVGLVHKMGYQIYLRDVSYLGFPAFQVYIPGLSEPVSLSKDSMQLAFQEIPFARHCLLKLKTISDTEMKHCVHSLEAIFSSPDFGASYKTSENKLFTRHITNIALEGSADFWCLHNDYLLALMNHRIGEYKGAYRHLSSFLENPQVKEGLPNLSYGLCIQAYFKLKADGIDPEGEQGSLRDIYGSEVVSVVLNDFRNRQDSFKGLKLPVCGNCLLCPVIQQCKYGRWVEITSKLSDRMKVNPINQEGLSDLSLLA